MTATLPSGQQINLVVFQTPEELARGLMGVPKMPMSAGALFCFPELRKQPFWTFGCRFSLDIVWLDESGCVVELATVPKCSQRPCPVYGGHTPALYVLELNAGVARQNGLVPGAQVGLRLDA